MKEKRIITILMVFTIIFTFFGASLAYWNWETSEAQRTRVVFTVGNEFQCAADGGGNITSEQVSLVPTDCTNTEYAIQRTVKVNPTIYKNDLSIYMDLWLQINNIGSGLSNSQNFRYALTKSPTSCTTGVVSQGNFNGKTNVEGNNTVQILGKSYTGTITETYYLYIWLDKAETSQTTMNQSFDLSLNGNCSQELYNPPEKPVLDAGMIPVTISEDGVATTVSADDTSWYDYSNKEWANVVLVKEEGTQLRSYYKNNTGKTVNEDDILAYYVWIPRYKYRMSSNTKCSEINNPTEAAYPECYGLPYTMSNTDKELFINYWYNNKDGWLRGEYGVTYTMAEATEDVETMLNTGEVRMEQEKELWLLIDLIQWYNEDNETPVSYSATYTMADDQKSLLINWTYDRILELGAENYTIEQATADVNNGFQTGVFTTTALENYEMPFEFWFSEYRIGKGVYLIYTVQYTISETDIELLANFFYENEAKYVAEDYEIEYTLENAIADVTEATNNGKVIIDNTYSTYYLDENVGWYNNDNDPDITYTGFKGNNYTKPASPVTIDIAFETTNSSVLTGDAVNTYRTHPAFIWDGETVAGIWVGKFETGHTSLSSSTTNNNLGCTDTNCANADGLIIKPNVQSLRYNNVSNFFYASRSMTRNTNTFGLNASTTDTHMMKNSEWGAVAYLSHSKYGINKEIYINNSYNFYTGRSGGNVGGSVDTIATHYSGETSAAKYIAQGYYTWTGQEIDASGIIGSYASDRTLGTNASTTGNVTGVYDMSGGTYEYVMGNYGNTIGYSGFTTFPDSKYYDLYSSTQFTGNVNTNIKLCTLETCGGHALSETVNWYLDYAHFVDSDLPWFVRGGGYSDGASVGAFYSSLSTGNVGTDDSFRFSAVVKGA